MAHDSDDCISCGENDPVQCPKSQRACGHHCNHSWSHDECCWCHMIFGEDGALLDGVAA